MKSILLRRMGVAVIGGLLAIGIAGFALPQKADAWYAITPQGVIGFSTYNAAAPVVGYFFQYPLPFTLFFGHDYLLSMGQFDFTLVNRPYTNYPTPIASATAIGVVTNPSPGVIVFQSTIGAPLTVIATGQFNSMYGTGIINGSTSGLYFFTGYRNYSQTGTFVRYVNPGLSGSYAPTTGTTGTSGGVLSGCLSFFVNPNSGYAPLTVTLNGTTAAGMMFQMIHRGDGGQTWNPNLTLGELHTYTLPGVYTITSYINTSPQTWPHPQKSCTTTVTVKPKQLGDPGGVIINPNPGTTTIGGSAKPAEVSSDNIDRTNMSNSQAPNKSALNSEKTVQISSIAVAQERKDFRTDYVALTPHVVKGVNVEERVAIRQTMVDAVKVLNDALKSLRQQYNDGVKNSVPFTRVLWRNGVNDLIAAYREAIIVSIDKSKMTAFDKSLEEKKLYLYEIYEKLEIIRRVQIMLTK